MENLKEDFKLLEEEKAQKAIDSVVPEITPQAAGASSSWDETAPQPDVNLDLSSEIVQPTVESPAPIQQTQLESNTKVSGPLNAGITPVPNVLGGASEAFKNQVLGTELEAQALKEENEQKANLLDQKMFLEEKKAKEKADLAKQKQENIDKRLSDINKDIETYSNTTIKDPNIWADKSVGAKILTGLGLFLGAAPNSSGQNTAVAVLEKVMQRNLEVQKANLDKMQKGIDFKRSALTDLYEVYKDKDLAIDAFNAASLGVIENQLKKLSEVSSNKKINANYQKAVGLIGQQKAELNNSIQKTVTDKYNAETNRMNVLFDQMDKLRKSEQRPENEFMKEKRKDEAAQYVKDLNNLSGIKAREENAKQAWSLLNRTTTGPVIGSGIAKFGRKFIDKDVQELETLFSKLGLDAVKQLSQEGGGAKSVDSDAEKKFILNTVPEIKKDNSVNKKVILAINSINKYKKLDTELKREFVSRYGNLDNYVSPLEQTKSYFNPQTGEVDYFEPGTQPPEFKDVAKELDGKDQITAQEMKLLKASKQQPNNVTLQQAKKIIENKYN